ncbi:DNA-binding response regulator, OmpR family, contains REC and winged-helix (wHTH) domain [Lachnospiraceae bacterium NE2001]|nr:DNA-binding response regulator, OmpR family, contains REC and winged-helix (wHTH) domain [Lachnospiraceae bacterium NE2001]
MEYKCLIVDDDITIAENTAEYFNIFDISTAFVTSYEEAISFLGENETSLVLLDINLGDRSGFELCKKIRQEFDMPILFISARKSDDDILTALNIGGDDYISKPFTMSILLAKVKAVLGRYEKAVSMANAVRDAAADSTDIISETSDGSSNLAGSSGRITITDDISLDTSTHKLIKNGEEIDLKIKEYNMLLYLLRNRGRVVTKDELLKGAWEDEFIGEGTLPVHARRLRMKLEDDPDNPKVLKTIWGVGYIVE